MEIISTQKFILLSPKKVRPVANLVKGMKPQEAVEKLPFVNKKGSEFLLKAIKTAIANAKTRGVSEENLFFKEIQISEGPRLKRGIAVSRGQWHPITKRMCHIRVILGVNKVKKIVKQEERQVKEVKKETIKKQKKGAKK